MTIEEIFALASPEEQIEQLKAKTITLPAWEGKKGLVAQYDPKKHPVMDRAKYPDNIDENGRPVPVSRITYPYQKLAVKRMTELVTGIPVKRVYKPTNDKQKEISEVMEKIYKRNRIDSVNVERFKRLFACCEVITLWHGTLEDNTNYGIQSKIKVRCRSFSPMDGDTLYPLFDEYGDLIALSVAYKRKVAGRDHNYFDAYTKEMHYKYSNDGTGWVRDEEPIGTGKIPGVYVYREEPIWEDTSNNVEEMEWSMSRNGNYLRDNSKPLFCVCADEQIDFGEEKKEGAEGTASEGKGVLQFPKGSSVSYVTWQQSIESLKFHIGELRQSFFTALQLPDWNYEKMSQMALSGESRKQLMVDPQSKVRDESGRLLEFLDREVNVVRTMLKSIFAEAYYADIDALIVENKITPFQINDDKETITNLMAANGGEPIMSQREAIEEFGRTDDVDKTLEEIGSQNRNDLFNEEDYTGGLLGGGEQPQPQPQPAPQRPIGFNLKGNTAQVNA